VNVRGSLRRKVGRVAKEKGGPAEKGKGFGKRTPMEHFTIFSRETQNEEKGGGRDFQGRNAEGLFIKGNSVVNSEAVGKEGGKGVGGGFRKGTEKRKQTF